MLYYAGTGTFINSQTDTFDDIIIEFYLKQRKTRTFMFTGTFQVATGDMVLFEVPVAGNGWYGRNPAGLDVTMVGQNLQIDGIFHGWSDVIAPASFDRGAARHLSGSFQLSESLGLLPLGFATFELNN